MTRALMVRLAFSVSAGVFSRDVPVEDHHRMLSSREGRYELPTQGSVNWYRWRWRLLRCCMERNVLHEMFQMSAAATRASRALTASVHSSD